MNQHNVGDKIGHSRYGNGTITATRTEMKTPDPIDVPMLTSERLKLQARVEEITRILAGPTQPYPIQICEVTFDKTGRVMPFEGASIDKMKPRYVPEEPPSE